MSFNHCLCWYQLPQTNFERKISLKLPNFTTFEKISTVEISVFKVIVLRELIIIQSHIFKYQFFPNDK